MPIPLLKRMLFGFAAIIALCIGALGLIIPIIPGVLFVALAAVLFAGASRRFDAKLRAKLHTSARTRPYLQRWEASESLSFGDRTKLIGLLMYAAAFDTHRRPHS